MIVDIMDEQTWVGLLNPGRTASCVTPAECSGKLLWIDNGEAFTDPSPSWIIDGGLVSDNKDNLCHVLKNSLVVQEEDCTYVHPFLCQYDCNTYESTSLLCPNGLPVPNGYFSVLGNFYQKSPAPAVHTTTASRCENLGGYLATVSHEIDYMALLALTGILREDIHVGLQNPNGTLCNTPTSCNNMLYWRQADNTFLPLNGSHIYNPIDAAHANYNCFYVDQSSDYKLRDEQCEGGSKSYFCQYQCPVSCLPPIQIANATNNSSFTPFLTGVIIRRVLVLNNMDFNAAIFVNVTNQLVTVTQVQMHIRHQ